LTSSTFVFVAQVWSVLPATTLKAASRHHRVRPAELSARHTDPFVRAQRGPSLAND
jgi:hypothetical protein